MKEKKTGLAERTDALLFHMLLGISALFLVFGVIAQPDVTLLQGLWAIQIGEAGLITDTIVTGGLGAALVNAALVLLVSVLTVRWMKLPFSGVTLACLFLMAAFSLMGKNVINTMPIVAGGWLYARYTREPFSKYVYLTFFATCLSPMVSFMINRVEIWLRWPAMIACGVAIGFLVPAVSVYTIRIHQGYNLYNVGFAAGFVGLGLASILKGFGVTFVTEHTWSQGNGLLLDLLVWGMLAGLVVLGIVLGCRSVRQYGRLLRHSGRAVADFILLDGAAVTFVNMGLTGAIGAAYLWWMEVDLNGPLFCCVLSMAGFGAFGKHPKNVIPVMAGAVLCSSVMGQVPITAPSVLLATLLCTGLAPIAGQFGWRWGLVSGFIHMAIVQNTAFLHGGMNLYNNGFAAGLTCILMIPIIKALKSEPEE